MAKTISIFNQKGGVGKTTVASGLASGLTLRGYKVLCIDLDHQCNFTSNGQVSREKGALDVLTGKMKAADVIQSSKAMGDFIAGNKALAVGHRYIPESVNEGARLKKALDTVKDNYDYILIDTHPILSIVTINALTASDSVIVPVGADIFEWEGVHDLIESLNFIRMKANPNIVIEGFLITRASERTNMHKGMQENLLTLAKQQNTKLFRSVIRESIAIKQSNFFKQPIFHFATKSRVASDFESLIDELTGETL